MKGYTKELVDFIEKNRMQYTTLEMVKLIKENFEKDITPKALRKYYDRHNLDFKKIYKRTDKNVNAKPIGTESNPDKNGLVRVKINNKQWQYKQRYIYEQYHRTKLTDDDVVIFADGDKTNYSPENLIAVQKDVARAMYAITKEDKPRSKETTKIGLNIARIKKKIKEKEKCLKKK